MSARTPAKRNRKKTKAQEQPEIALTVLSNNPRPMDYDLLQMLYTGAFANELALMHAKNKETDEIQILLCGMEWSVAQQKMQAYPLAVLLQPEEVARYLAPDGNGGFE